MSTRRSFLKFLGLAPMAGPALAEAAQNIAAAPIAKPPDVFLSAPQTTDCYKQFFAAIDVYQSDFGELRVISNRFGGGHVAEGNTVDDGDDEYPFDDSESYYYDD